jgi:hypothetical protein
MGRRINAKLPICMLAIVASVLACDLPALAAEQGEVWVIYQGKEQFRLEEAKTVPFARLASLRGYGPFAKPADVWIHDPETGELIELPVEEEPSRAYWTAMLPKLPAKSETQITIRQYFPVDESRFEELEKQVFRVLLAIDDGFIEGRIPPTAPVADMRLRIGAYLRERFTADTAVSKYLVARPDGSSILFLDTLISHILVDFGHNDHIDLAGIVNEIANGYRHVVQQLRDVDSDRSRAVKFAEPEAYARVQKFARDHAALDVGLTESRAALGREIQSGNCPIPLDYELRRDLVKFFEIAYSDRPAVVENLKRAINTTLSQDMKEKLKEGFDILMELRQDAYSFSSADLPFVTADMLRYGTVDFVTAYMGGDYRQSRGFLTFSFSPIGLSPRTPPPLPEDAVSNRLHLTLGYSVTGGDESDPSVILLGVSVRLSRLASVVVGYAAPDDDFDGGALAFGLAGDVTVIPLLENFFTTK